MALLTVAASRSLSDTEPRYALLELGCLGVYYAAQKLEYYLKGNTHTLPQF